MRRCASTLEAEMTPEEHAFLLDLVRCERKEGRHLEVGTAAGGTLVRMMHCFDAVRRPPFVVVDPMGYFPEQYETVIRNLREHGLSPQDVDFRRQSSAAAFEQAAVRGEEFDFMLIDACHKVMSVMSDLRWTRLLSVGGIVCLHDYSWEHKGVMLAVNRFRATCPNYKPLGCVGSLLALRKTAPSPAPEVTRADRLYSALLYLPLQIERKLQKFTRTREAA